MMFAVHRFACLSALVLVLTMVTTSRAAAQEPLSGWSLSGQNIIRSEWYHAHGDESASSFSEQGNQVYDEISIDFRRRYSPFNKVSGYASGVISDSQYRSARHGGTLERFNVTQENGGSTLPYLLEVGDYYGFFTPRIQQQSLKGIQFEAQPETKWFGASHSMQTHLGGVAQDYQEDASADRYWGGSWLLDWEKQQLSLNVSSNRQSADGDTDTPALDQLIIGGAYHHGLALGKQNIEIDAEINQFRGDPAGTGAEAANNHQTALARFFSLKGKSRSPLTYSVRLEDNDAGYLPNGASVSGDRLSSEFRSGWRFEQGLSLQGRYQFYRDDQHSGNATDTHVLGASLAGTILQDHVRGLNMSLGAFIQRAGDEAETTRTESRSVTTNFSAPIAGQWSGTLQLSFQDSRDRLTGIHTSLTRQVGTNLNHPLQLFGFTGSASGGIAWREVRAPSGGDSNEPGFNLSANLSHGAHRLNAALRYLDQDRLADGIQDMTTDSANVAYQYVLGQHAFRFDADIYRRRPDNARDTSDCRFGLTYVFTFDQPARAEKTAGTAFSPTDGIGAEIPFEGRLLTALSPGIRLEQAESWLKRAGISDGLRLPGARVYETRFYDEIDQRQRLVLEHNSADVIQGSAILIDLADTGALEDIEQLYHRLQSILAQRYGRPVTFEKGRFSADLASDLKDGDFIRISEWTTPSGTLRLGIPLRVDGRIRIEVQLRDKMPDYRDTHWSIESVR